MELKDLKNGHIVEIKDGTLLLVVKFENKDSKHTTDVAISEDSWVNLSHYRNNFRRIGLDSQSEFEEKRNIVAVYEPKRSGVCCTLKELLNKENLNKIWEYEEIKKMTKGEIEKELGYKFELISEQ